MSMISSRWCGILLPILSLSVPGLIPAAHGQSALCAVNPGAPIWNGSILFSDALAADIASSGCRRVRINFRIDGNTTWTASHLAKYDTIINSARSHGLEVMGLICYEAVHAGQADWNQNYNTTGLNPYTYTFADNAWLLINRYKNDVKLFEIWNEPDCWSVNPATNPLTPGCFYIWPKNYANLLAETYKKCINAGGANFFTANGVSLVTGGLFAHDIGGSFSTSRSYMTSVYNQNSIWSALQSATGRRYPWDYFGYHFYLNQGQAVSTAELLDYFNDIRDMKDDHDDPSPILVTEFGWGSSAVGLQLQADNLRDCYDWFRTQPDILSAFWYQWNDGDGSWGLVFSIGNPKPSYYAFAGGCGIEPAPEAAFSAQPLTGRVPLTVTFTNASTGGSITSHQWNFGDGGSSSQLNPVHTYESPGSYTVSLEVSGPGGDDTETKVDYIIVQPPRVAADLDGDNDVDGDDFDLFAPCVTGPNQTMIPIGCGTGTASVPPPLVEWMGAATMGGLDAAISAADLIHGVSGVLESGGFHGATPGGSAGGLADLTDAVQGSNVEAVLRDYPGGDPPNTADPLNRALQVRYDWTSPRHIQEIRVFAANVTSPGDGRVFQNYDVEYSTSDDETFRSLAQNVTTGPFGRPNAVPSGDPSYLGATLTRIVGDGTPAAANVDSLRFIFYPVADTAGRFLDEFDTLEAGDADGIREAFVSSILKEIDVIEWMGELPPASNIADLDGDADVDQADFAILQRCLSGPYIPADPACEQ